MKSKPKDLMPRDEGTKIRIEDLVESCSPRVPVARLFFTQTLALPSWEEVGRCEAKALAGQVNRALEESVPEVRGRPVIARQDDIDRGEITES